MNHHAGLTKIVANSERRFFVVLLRLSQARVKHCKKGSLRFGKDGRLGAVTLRALRKAASGTLQDLYTLSTVA